MSREPVFNVWLKQGRKRISLAKTVKDRDEAIKTCNVLNDGLQRKAKDMGFKYRIEVKQK